jgi:antitoxin HicB
MSDTRKYLELPYTLYLRRDKEGDFVAKIEELPGCIAHGKTREEALANLDEAKVLWIEDCLENGYAVPLPSEEEELPSGKWLQRVPRKLHRKLQILSRRENVSFNQCILAILAEAVGERVPKPAEQVQSRQVDPYSHLNVLSAGYNVLFAHSYDTRLPEFQVVDATSVATKTWVCRESLLAHLSGQLPNQFELKPGPKKVVKKDDQKKHASFESC